MEMTTSHLVRQENRYLFISAKERYPEVIPESLFELAFVRVTALTSRGATSARAT